MHGRPEGFSQFFERIEREGAGRSRPSNSSLHLCNTPASAAAPGYHLGAHLERGIQLGH